ncbi:MAG: hypothetical protein U9N44_03855 [Chloroflexota bacterium]|nr:hypothetical protein [Chloroflexota bacterium]
MKVWSRGLGKQSLYADWFKSDIKVEGSTLIADGIVRDKGIIWDCRFYFEKDDVPGLLYMLFSGPVVRHFLKNFKFVLSFFLQRYIKRTAGKEKVGKKAA